MISADTPSRAHIEETDGEIPEDELLAQVHNSAATNDKLLEKLTSQDPIWSEIANFAIKGWPSTRQSVSGANKTIFILQRKFIID